MFRGQAAVCQSTAHFRVGHAGVFIPHVFQRGLFIFDPFFLFKVTGLQKISLPDGADYNQLDVTTDYTRIIRNLTRSGNKVTFDLRENNDGYDRTAEIELVCGGSPYDPFSQAEDGLGVTILKHMGRSLTYDFAQGANRICVCL